MGNWFAYAAIGIWPIVTIWLYRTKTVTEATLWAILGGHMLLPVRTEVDFPMIPPLGKESIPALAAFIGCQFVARKRVSFLGKSGLVRWLLLLYIVGPFMTAELNGDAVYVGGHHLPPMTHYDALSAVVNQLIFIMPFFLGRQLFRTYEDQLLMFQVLIVAGLFYSLLMLFEVRMSPQLHTWFYGYFPHSFGQQMRYGGFRPVVFMGHGLLVSFFAVITVIAASVFWRLKIKVRRFSPAGVTYYFMFILLLCKSVGSIIYGFSAFLLIKFTSLKMQLRAARILILIALLYPTLSILNLFPHQTLMDWAVSMDADRAQSLGVRFDNEHVLLDHARKRFFFGWGTWGRNRLYSEQTGEDITITDGRWIITFGQFGWMGFVAEFGLLAMSAFRAIASFKLLKIENELGLLCAHALLIGVIMIDQIPNSSIAPWLWLVTGILLGRAETILEAGRKRVTSKLAVRVPS
jgi:hypothetical protein